MCEMIVMLSSYANKEKISNTRIEVNDPEANEGKMYISDVTHPILLFVERLIIYLRSSKDKFVNSPGRLLSDWPCCLITPSRVVLLFPPAVIFNASFCPLFCVLVV